MTGTDLPGLIIAILAIIGTVSVVSSIEHAIASRRPKTWTPKPATPATRCNAFPAASGYQPEHPAALDLDALRRHLAMMPEPPLAPAVIIETLAPTPAPAPEESPAPEERPRYTDPRGILALCPPIASPDTVLTPAIVTDEPLRWTDLTGRVTPDARTSGVALFPAPESDAH